MSDLASSCEYLTSEKLCLAVSESEKAKSARQARCKNDEKTTCCYLCMFVLDCATPCRFLNGTESVPQRINEEKSQVSKALVNEEKPKVEETKDTEATLCSLCNVEMSQTKTKFKIEEWEGSTDNSDKLWEKVLPVKVYLCSKCGKIEFKADKKLDKN